MSALGPFVCVALSVASLADADCIDVTVPDWQANLTPHFGERVCIVGPLSVGADGVFMTTDPRAGPPPYGGLISVDIAKAFAAEQVPEAGTRVAVAGTLLGREFCKANPMVDGCGAGDATFFKYHLHKAMLSEGGAR